MRQYLSKYIILCLSIYLIWPNSNLKARLPIMNITFGGALQQSCQFVDNQEVIDALNATLNTLQQIENVRDECQSLLINSRSFVQSYLAYSKEWYDELLVAKSNYEVITDEIRRLQADGKYNGEYDLELLNLTKDIRRLQSNQHIRSSSLTQTLQLGSSVFEAMELNPTCNLSFTQHVLAPTISMLGSISSYALTGVNPAFGAAANFLSNAIAYFGRIREPSYQELRNLMESSNYFLSYKCAFKNIEEMTCKLEEEEVFTRNENLHALALKIMAMDSTGEFKRLRDLERHRYRLSDLIDRLENIFNSPEIFDDLNRIVQYKTLISKLKLAPKLPPFSNFHYIEAMKAAKLPVEIPARPWQGFDKNQIDWSTWWHSYFYPVDYLRNAAIGPCSKLAQENRAEFGSVFNAASGECNPITLIEERLIDHFIQKVIVPALVELQREVIRLNQKIKANPNVQNLYSEVRTQEVYTGHPDYREFTLSRLLSMYREHAFKYSNSPAHFFAIDLQNIAIALSKLLKSAKDYNEFTETAREAYSEIATISNNGQAGGILYKEFIESKVSAYFEHVSNSFILNPDQEVARKFVLFNYLADLHRNFSNQLDQADGRGSSNLPLMREIRESFLEVFGDVMSSKTSYLITQFRDRNLNKREVLHSCAIYLPFIGSTGFRDRNHQMKKICENLINQNQGLSLLRNDHVKYPLYPANRPSYHERCYYMNYSREVMARKIQRYRERIDGSIRF